MLCVQFTRLVTDLNWSSFIGIIQQDNSIKCNATYLYIAVKNIQKPHLKFTNFNMAKAVSVPTEIQTWPQKMLEVTQTVPVVDLDWSKHWIQ